jgi:hypothetical protein
MQQTFPLICTVSVGYSRCRDRHQGLPWAAYLPKRALAAPMANPRVRTSLTLAATIALWAAVVFVGWAWMRGGDHATWMGDSPVSFMVTVGCFILLSALVVGAVVGMWRLLAAEPPDLDPW